MEKFDSRCIERNSTLLISQQRNRNILKEGQKGLSRITSLLPSFTSLSKHEVYTSKADASVTRLGSQGIIAVSLVIKTGGLCQAQAGGFLHVSRSSLWSFDTFKKMTGAPLSKLLEYIEPSHAPANPLSVLQHL